MNLTTKIKRELERRYGSFSTNLERQYQNKLVKILTENNIIETKLIWLTYNQIILEAKKNNLIPKVNELLYLLTDDVINNNIILDSLESLKGKSQEFNRLYNKLKTKHIENEKYNNNIL